MRCEELNRISIRDTCAAIIELFATELRVVRAEGALRQVLIEMTKGRKIFGTLTDSLATSRKSRIRLSGNKRKNGMRLEDAREKREEERGGSVVGVTMILNPTVRNSRLSQQNHSVSTVSLYLSDRAQVCHVKL